MTTLILTYPNQVATLMYDSAQDTATSVEAYRDSLSRGARALVGPMYSSVAKYLALLGGIDQVCPRVAIYPIRSRAILS